MRLSLLSSALFLGAASVAFAVEGSDVIDVTVANFNAEIQSDLILVEFFSPWCGHCQALAPHYEEAATALKDKGIKLAKVNCVDQPELCQQQRIGGYPTLKIFHKGEATEYKGTRKSDGIISYMVKKSLPAVTKVTTANHEEFKDADNVVLVAYLASPTDDLAPAFSAVAEQNRDSWLFGLTTDAEVIANAGVTPPAIVLYKKFDEGRQDLTKAHVSETELLKFIKDNSVPLVDEISGENHGFYTKMGLPLAYLFLDPTDASHEQHISNLKKTAEKYRGRINFVWIDALRFGAYAKALDLREAKWPSFVIHEIDVQLKFPLDQSVGTSIEVIDAFIEEYASGKLKPDLKSQPIPETQDESVFTLVEAQFDEVVFDDGKDVFIDFYAPWCGHCKRLSPIWGSLGDEFAPFKDKITIAKMDATENDLPPSASFKISGFPTLKFKPAGTRGFIDYTGDRTLEALTKFVLKNAKNQLGPPPEPKNNFYSQFVPIRNFVAALLL